MSDRRLLVVDDEMSVTTFVAQLARGMGYHVETTTDGLDFQTIYCRFKPTTIVLDIVMPKIDGIELVLWLAKMQCPAQIIVMTGFDAQYVAMAALIGQSSGLRPIIALIKPVDVARLRQALDPAIAAGEGGYATGPGQGLTPAPSPRPS